MCQPSEFKRTAVIYLYVFSLVSNSFQSFCCWCVFFVSSCCCSSYCLLLESFASNYSKSTCLQYAAFCVYAICYTLKLLAKEKSHSDTRKRENSSLRKSVFRKISLVKLRQWLCRCHSSWLACFYCPKIYFEVLQPNNSSRGCLLIWLYIRFDLNSQVFVDLSFCVRLLLPRCCSFL